MKFPAVSACATLLLAATALAAPAPLQQPRDLAVYVTIPSPQELVMLAEVNKVRTANNKIPLCINKKLTTAAHEHARDMSMRDYIGSAGATGLSPTERAIAQGFNTTGVAEVVGGGYADEADAIKNWMASPAYSMYLLGNYKYMGAGYGSNFVTTVYQTFWVLDFDNQAVGEACV